MSPDDVTDTQAWVAQTYAALDRQYQQLADLYRDKMQCHAGCFGCCSDGFTIRQAEWHAVQTHLASLDVTVLQHIQHQLTSPDYAQTKRCPLLLRGQCTVYESRPLVCRGFGVKVETATGVSTCPLNFNDLLQDAHRSEQLAVLPLAPFYDVLNDLSSPDQPARTLRDWLRDSG